MPAVTVFEAIAHPTRRALLQRLSRSRGARSIGEITAPFPASRQAISKHLKLLAAAGLIKIQAKGKHRYCSANPKKLKKVSEWVAYYEPFWNEHLESLDRHLKQPKPG